MRWDSLRYLESARVTTPGVFTFKTLKYRYAIATPGKQKSRQPPANADNFGSNRVKTTPHLVPLESNYT